jgi:hypothetical protein
VKTVRKQIGESGFPDPNRAFNGDETQGLV